jgi:hypothetical protein
MSMLKIEVKEWEPRLLNTFKRDILPDSQTLQQALDKYHGKIHVVHTDSTFEEILVKVISTEQSYHEGVLGEQAFDPTDRN